MRVATIDAILQLLVISKYNEAKSSSRVLKFQFYTLILIVLYLSPTTHAQNVFLYTDSAV